MSDEAVHYMESTSRLRDELEESKRIEARWHELYIAAEATMREVASENERLRLALQVVAVKAADDWTRQVARGALDPPPVEEKQTCPHPKACWGETVCLSGEGGGRWCDDARLSPPPVVEKPLHAYFPSDVDAGGRSPCAHCGQFLEAHIPPSVVENPPA